MSHSHPEGTLSDVLDGQLDDRASRAWQQHLTDCAECRAELAQLRLVQRAAREWTPSDTGADHWPALRAKVMAPDVTAISQPRRPRRRTEASIAAATLAVAAMLVLIFRTRVPTPAWPSEVAAGVRQDRGARDTRRCRAARGRESRDCAARSCGLVARTAHDWCPRVARSLRAHRQDDRQLSGRVHACAARQRGWTHEHTGHRHAAATCD